MPSDPAPTNGSEGQTPVEGDPAPVPPAPAPTTTATTSGLRKVGLLDAVPGLFATPREDLIAGSVVFLVALPLCLGIAVASHAPPLAGLIAGIVGGLVIPIISRARLSVSGPAAGLTAIVVAGATELGSYPALASAVFLAGVFQIVFGAVRAGALAAIVPASVIKAMLSAIGVILIIGQVSILLGVPAEMIDVDSVFLSADRIQNIGAVARATQPGSVVIALVSMTVIALWRRLASARLQWLPSSLVVVLLGTALAEIFDAAVPALALPRDQLINLPFLSGDADFRFADFGALRRTKTWTIGITIALVATIESLLSIEALDRMTGARTPRNRELVAHGVGNAIAGFLCGLPITAVIVRSSANVQAGAKSKLSAIFHGLLLFIAVAALAPLLRHIPIACLAAILLSVGLKLASPMVLRQELKLGYESWVPFLVTLVAVVVTDLLRGVLFGFLVSILVVLKHATRDTVVMKRVGKNVHVDFLRDATFLVKPALVTILEDVQEGETVIVDCTSVLVDPDVREVLATFAGDAKHMSITVEIIGLELGDVRAVSH